MSRIIHVCQSVDGAIKNWGPREWKSLAQSNNMTIAAVKEQFRIMQFEGKKVIPIGEPCDGFSYQDRCPGHEELDSVIESTKEGK